MHRHSGLASSILMRTEHVYTAMTFRDALVIWGVIGFECLQPCRIGSRTIPHEHEHEHGHEGMGGDLRSVVLLCIYRIECGRMSR